MPLETAQSGGTSWKTSLEQPYSDSGTIVSGDAVDTKTLTSCSGVPTLMLKVLHGPSFPSLRDRRWLVSKRQLKQDAINKIETVLMGIYKYSLAGITRGVGALSAKHRGMKVPITHTVKVRCILYESLDENTGYEFLF